MKEPSYLPSVASLRVLRQALREIALEFGCRPKLDGQYPSIHTVTDRDEFLREGTIRLTNIRRRE